MGGHRQPSRAWAIFGRDLLTAPIDDPLRARLIDRHVAWLTALRYQLREPLITSLIEQQGKCERIKNFPYPRQFATLNLAFVWLFVAILPFAVYGELHRTSPTWTWLTVPLSALMAWVFHTMDKIGSASENPFEGGPNDVPISAMSRAIEIDLRDLQDSPLPAPLAPVGNILM